VKVCPKCKRGRLQRVEREGFLENSVYPRLGYFPWICTECKARNLVKFRGERKRKRSSGDVPAHLLRDSDPS
jgi:ssDNA-binding Zn-finger/Zn-ribbon topoisomerase 1